MLSHRSEEPATLPPCPVPFLSQGCPAVAAPYTIWISISIFLVASCTTTRTSVITPRSKRNPTSADREEGINSAISCSATTGNSVRPSLKHVISFRSVASRMPDTRSCAQW